jgi:hypothetical protein
VTRAVPEPGIIEVMPRIEPSGAVVYMSEPEYTASVLCDVLDFAISHWRETLVWGGGLMAILVSVLPTEDNCRQSPRRPPFRA